MRAPSLEPIDTFFKGVLDMLTPLLPAKFWLEFAKDRQRLLY